MRYIVLNSFRPFHVILLHVIFHLWAISWHSPSFLVFYDFKLIYGCLSSFLVHFLVFLMIDILVCFFTILPYWVLIFVSQCSAVLHLACCPHIWVIHCLHHFLHSLSLNSFMWIHCTVICCVWSIVLSCAIFDVVCWCFISGFGIGPVFIFLFSFQTALLCPEVFFFLLCYLISAVLVWYDRCHLHMFAVSGYQQFHHCHADFVWLVIVVLVPFIYYCAIGTQSPILSLNHYSRPYWTIGIELQFLRVS